MNYKLKAVKRTPEMGNHLQLNMKTPFVFLRSVGKSIASERVGLYNALVYHTLPEQATLMQQQPDGSYTQVEDKYIFFATEPSTYVTQGSWTNNWSPSWLNFDSYDITDFMLPAGVYTLFLQDLSMGQGNSSANYSYVNLPISYALILTPNE